MSFLKDYIGQRYLEYEEPTRKGTAKGEKIGLSKKKYLAAVLAGLLNHRLKDIAAGSTIITVNGEAVSFNYDVLRKWRTEEEFDSAMHATVHDFTEKLILKIEEYTEKLLRDEETEDIARYIYADAKELNLMTCTMILEAAMRKFPDFENSKKDLYVRVIVNNINELAGYSDRGPEFDFNLMSVLIDKIETGDLPKKEIPRCCQMIKGWLNIIKPKVLMEG